MKRESWCHTKPMFLLGGHSVWRQGTMSLIGPPEIEAYEPLMERYTIAEESNSPKWAVLVIKENRRNSARL